MQDDNKNKNKNIPDGGEAPPFPQPYAVPPPPPASSMQMPEKETVAETEQETVSSIPQGMDMNEPAEDIQPTMGAQTPTQMPGPVTPEANVPMQQPQVVTEKESKSKFPLLIGILVFLAVAIYGVVAYLYFDNQRLKNEAQAPVSSQSAVPAAEPTAMVETFQYMIDNGSIKKVSSSGTEQVLVSKDDYTGTGITGFSNVVASDAGNYLCFWALPPALSPALYYADTSGGTPVMVSEKSKNCIWAPNEDKLAYIEDVTEGNPVDIFLYTLADDSSDNLTGQAATTSAVFRRYQPTGFSADGTKVLCSYEQIDTENPSSENLGNCEAEIASGVVTDIQTSNP